MKVSAGGSDEWWSDRKERSPWKRKGTIGSPFWNRMPVTGSQSVPLLFLTGCPPSRLYLRQPVTPSIRSGHVRAHQILVIFLQARTVPHKSSTKRKGTDGTKFWNEPTWRCHQNPFIGALGIINLLSLASHKSRLNRSLQQLWLAMDQDGCFSSSLSLSFSLIRHW